MSAWKGETSKLARILACGAALSLASAGLQAGDGSSEPGDQGATSNPSPDQEETLILLEPIEAQSLYGVDEDGDGLIDYLILEEPDTLARLGNEPGEESDELPEGE